MSEKPVKVEIVADSSKYKKALDEAHTETTKFGKATSGVGKALAGAFVGGAVVSGIENIVGAASDYNETVSKTKVVLGSAADGAISFAEDAANSFGLSQQAALDAQATFAVFGKSAGLSGDSLGQFSGKLTGLAADMASFSNTSPQQAIDAIGAALRGESEPIRAYGVLLDDATLRQTAMKMGIYDGNGALTAQQKVLAAQKAIFDQTNDAQGDFARTSGGLAGQQKILAAEFDNVKVKLGQGLIPVAIKAFEILNKLAFGGDAAAKSFEKVADVSQKTSADIVNNFNDLIKATGDARSGFDQAQHGVGGFFDSLAAGLPGVEGNAEAVRNFDKAMGDLAKRSPDNAASVVKALQDVLTSAEQGSKAAQTYVDKYDLTHEKLDALAATLPMVSLAVDDHTLAFEHMGLANQDTARLIRDSNAALADQAMHAGDAQRATDNLKASWDLLKQGLSDQQQWIDVENSFADVKQAGIDAWDAAKNHSADADQKARDYQSSILTLKGKVMDYAKDVGGLPEQQITTIMAQIDNGSIQSASALLDEIAHDRQVNYNAIVAGHRESIPGHASGTTNAENAFIAGENGPELVVGKGGATVYTASQTAAMGGSGGGVQIGEVHLHVQTMPSPDDLMRMVEKWRSRNGNAKWMVPVSG